MGIIAHAAQVPLESGARSLYDASIFQGCEIAAVARGFASTSFSRASSLVHKFHRRSR
jgi:hypothetical protein